MNPSFKGPWGTCLGFTNLDDLEIKINKKFLLLKIVKNLPNYNIALHIFTQKFKEAWWADGPFYKFSKVFLPSKMQTVGQAHVHI